MSRREDIDNSIWGDDEFVALGPHAKLVYFWSFTNPRCGMAGLYKVVLPVAALEVGMTAEEMKDAVSELQTAGFLFYEAGVLFVRTRVKHLRQKTGTIAVAIRNDVAKIGEDHPLRLRFLETYADHPWLRDGLDGVKVGSRWGHDTPSEKDNSEPFPDGVSRGSRGGPDGAPGTGTGTGTGVVEEQNRSVARKTRTAPNPVADLDADQVAVHGHVLEILERVAVAKQATSPNPAAVARQILDLPLRPHIEAAQDLEAWVVYGTGRSNRVKDVVAYWRNQLKRHGDRAVIANSNGGGSMPRWKLEGRPATTAELLGVASMADLPDVEPDGGWS